MNKNTSGTYLLSITIITMVLFACNPTKKIESSDYLLTKSRVIDTDTKLNKSDIESYIKQKPNKKILGVFRFHLWLHNLANENKIKRRRVALNKKNEARNVKRISKNKKVKKFERQLLGEWLLNIGEAPTVYDSTLSKKTSKQIHLFLKNKGYFINSVSDSVYYKKRKRAKVYYTIKAAEPYKINKIDFNIQDKSLNYYFFKDTLKTLVKKGDRYDVDVLQQERDRITSQLKNLGFYYFTKDYIFYEIDTTLGNKRVGITIGIKKFAKKYSDDSDSIIETNHKKFFIGNVFIETDFSPKSRFTAAKDTIKKDTLVIDNYNIIYTNKLKYRTKLLLSAVFLHKNDVYKLQNEQDTYKRLSELKEFKTIFISFSNNGDDSLNCYIQLSPIQKQLFSIETEGTNTSGNLGISGSFTYQNRNLLKGAEVFELRLKGGIQAQPTFDNTNTQIENLSDAPKQFNTIEFGPELNIYVPRFLLPFRVKQSKRSNPKTIFSASLTYQSRPDYTRTINNLSFGYTWKETSKKRHTISPLIINFVKVDKSQAFEDYLNKNVKNLYIINSFSNHLSTSTRYIFNYNEQNLNKHENFSYFKLNAESSGNILRGIYNVVNQIEPNTLKKDQYGRYELMDIVYSQYLRIDGDFRYYLNKNEINKIVFRFAAGIGKPLENFPVLPFERSFFSGGANGIRAWQSRTLGPGSYSDDGTFSFDQFGDGQIEANIEYRFKLFKKLNGALFVDGGNTWLRRPEINRPGGEFDINRFYKEIAIGSGIGVRADFNFFIIRFDTGIKTHDPQFDSGERWVIRNLFNPEWKRVYKENHNNNKYTFFTFNLGIGYPF